eukprot:COSAG02_NODE_19494_length_879_cov_0.985897_1_plen_260_part_10
MALQPASSVVAPMQDVQVGPGCRRRPTQPAAEGGFGRSSGTAPSRAKPKTWPIRRGPGPKPGALSARLGHRPSPPLEPTSQPPRPELHAATAREPVYSRDGWQWEQDCRPASSRTGSASVRLEPLRRELKPELKPEPEPELPELCMRPAPPQGSARARSTVAQPAAANPLMLVSSAAPSALACAMPVPVQLPQPPAALTTVEEIDATPSTRDEAAAGQLRSQKVRLGGQHHHQQEDHQQPKQNWLYGNLDQPNDGREAQR